ncbi:MAG: hypothetical protein QS98_C0003G0082 [archaeon GW2011_AR3]|nr:MAG: hypothetical protein QS98_C0003G0082 [archaeon GW2011_AR3]MBS3110124.1 hypothetical protein [Candidatus Woesearchaeota archaeon]
MKKMYQIMYVALAAVMLFIAGFGGSQSQTKELSYVDLAFQGGSLMAMAEPECHHEPGYPNDCLGNSTSPPP